MALARRATRRRMIQRRRCFRAADSSSLSAPTTSATSYSPTYFLRPSPPRPRHASSSPPLRCMIRHPAAATWARRRRWARSKASARGRDSIWSTAGRTTRTRRAPRLPTYVTTVLIYHTSTTLRSLTPHGAGVQGFEAVQHALHRRGVAALGEARRQRQRLLPGTDRRPRWVLPLPGAYERSIHPARKDAILMIGGPCNPGRVADPSASIPIPPCFFPTYFSATRIESSRAGSTRSHAPSESPRPRNSADRRLAT